MKQFFFWIFAFSLGVSAVVYASDPDCSFFTYKANGTLNSTKCFYVDPVHGRVYFDVNLSTPQITINGAGDITNAATYRASVRSAFQSDLTKRNAARTAALALDAERRKITVPVRESDIQ